MLWLGLMAIAQLVRLLVRPELVVAGYAMPLWPSVLALIILGGLSLDVEARSRADHVNASPTTPNPAFERTAASALRMLAKPSSLRSSAAAQRERWASRTTLPHVTVSQPS